MIEAGSVDTQMMVVMALVVCTIVLFVTEWVRLDVAALLILVALGLVSLCPGVAPLLPPSRLFSGFSSNAVVAIIAVMILGAGLDKTGVMNTLARWIMRIAGTTEGRLVPTLSCVAGGVSGLIQNAGAAALFLPVISRISARTGVALSRFLMPVGYAIMLGGTLTLIGSSPLIVLNDLLPPSMEPFRLFDVFPVGLALLLSGIGYVTVFGKRLIPVIPRDAAMGESTAAYFEKVYGLNFVIREMQLKPDATWNGRTIGELEKSFGVVVVAVFMRGELRVGPWRGLELAPRGHLAIWANEDRLLALENDPAFTLSHTLDVFSDALSYVESGIAEVVLPPGSQLVGRTLTEVAMRKQYGLSVLAIRRGDETIRDGRRDIPLKPGDTLACHCAWEALARVENDKDFVVVTSAYPHEQRRPQKVGFALLFFVVAMVLAVFTDVLLALALLAGAVGMVVTRVLTMDEAYRAVSWRTVFMLAGLIPLGMAVQQSGVARWLAFQAITVLGTPEPWLIQALLVILATLFTLVMTNIGATVLLVPIAIEMAMAAEAAGFTADPRVFALLVAIAASNGFLLPTNQVMSIYAGPGGYRNKDFTKVGGGLTLLFAAVTLLMLYLLY